MNYLEVNMLIDVLKLGLIAGVGHFILIGLLYGNPFVAKQYASAMATHPSVRKWESIGKYRLIQFLGTQVEVFLITLAYLWFRPMFSDSSAAAVIGLGMILAAIRVYPRFWNMWIQTTYPRNLLAIEIINGTIGTLAIAAILEGMRS
jgi:hypothetical protein